MNLRFRSKLIFWAVVALGCALCCMGQTPAEEQKATDPVVRPPLDQRMSGSISGTVFDQSDAVVAGARVRLSHPEEPGKDPVSREVVSGADGQFVFSNIAPGSFQLTVTSSGFATLTLSGMLHSSEIYTVPKIALAVATNVTDIEVGLSQTEVAEEEIKVEEKQRVLGVIPNFYVTYNSNAVSLSAKQKFELAWKTLIDPFTFAVVAGTAGVEQGQNHFAGYGQGVQGYAKRFGANYADAVAGTLIGAAILPSLLKQDPRYFYKGTGSIPSRFSYAIANSIICKGDSGRWQPNYSNVLGSLAAGGVSNLYYPEQDRNGVGLTFENAGIGVGATAITNVFQEFVIKKFTPKAKREPAQP